MRLTDDGHEVNKTDSVYEILWVYYNAEYSEAVPQLTVAKDVPPKTKIWKHYYCCFVECQKLTKQNKEKIDNSINKLR